MFINTNIMYHLTYLQSERPLLNLLRGLLHKEGMTQITKHLYP